MVEPVKAVYREVSRACAIRAVDKSFMWVEGAFVWGRDADLNDMVEGGLNVIVRVTRGA